MRRLLLLLLSPWLLLSPSPTLAQVGGAGSGFGIGPLCGGLLALDSVTPSMVVPGETVVVVRSLAAWPLRLRQAAPPVVVEEDAPPPARRDEAGRLSLPPGLAFEVPAELLDRALTRRLFPGGEASRTAAPASVAAAAPAWRSLRPGEALSLRVAPGAGDLMGRLGLRCEAP